ncbi:MAG: LptF/LptG family permease, partial [Planctomycetota bacterium]|nr:LptF/LptG family permease [Planctomycetota bacterium]
ARRRSAGLLPVLDRWVLGQFARAYLAFASAILIVTTVVDFATHVEDFKREGSSFLASVLARYAALLPELFFVIGPLLGVLAAAWVIGSMRANQELLALGSIGVSPGRIALPFLVGGAALALVVWVDREHVLPRTGEGQERLVQRRKEMRFPRPVPDTSDGVLVTGVLQTRTDTLEKVRYVWLDEHGAERRVLLAPALRPEPGRPGTWRLEKGGLELVRAADADGLGAESTLLPPGATLTTTIRQEDVEAAIDDLPAYRSSTELRRQLRRTPGFKHLAVQLHEVVARPLAAIGLLLVTVPLLLGGAGGGPSRALLCAAVVGGSFVLQSACHQLGVRGALPALAAAYAPVAVLGLVGALVLWRERG